MEGVISVFRSKTMRLHTTRSWDFMGLSVEHGQSTPLQLAYGDDIVVGIFDTGVWPESKSFEEDLSLKPIPGSWAGKCVKGESFKSSQCNRKLVGARYYLEAFEERYGPLNKTSNFEYRSARDALGHGTHVASTAVGSVVGENASFFGLGKGLARGGAPRARLAVYKVCWNRNFQGTCEEADIMAAFDDAIRDGVHVISASLGQTPPLPPLFSSATDIGAFHAAQVGVSVVFSAGNDGPDPSLVQNVAPWSTSVAATDIDRTFPTKILLGNNISTLITGQGFMTQHVAAELVFSVKYFIGGSLSHPSSFTSSLDNLGATFQIPRICEFGRWRGKFATGKVILCFSTIGPQLSGDAAVAVAAANASALIFATTTTRNIANVDFIPTVYVEINQGTQILNYIQSQPSKPSTVQIFSSQTVIGSSPAPVVAYFSSRGPNSLNRNILKPDVSAPGVNILAAWSPKTPPALHPLDSRSVKWNFESGTSMACPHVAGIIALLKSAHPDWSPAALKSAIMTTAYTVDTSSDRILAAGSPKVADPFDIGAGHVDPINALDPGLVYDMDARDQVLFLCSIGYTNAQIKAMILSSPWVDTHCPRQPEHRPTELDLNYPAIVVSDLVCSVSVERSLRNVGHCPAVYFASVEEPHGVRVEVSPRVLLFTPQKEVNTYHVTLAALKQSRGRYDFGKIVWSDGHHHVAIPLAVRVSNAGMGSAAENNNL
ncbi:hypothetical protein ACLOJK_033655 [Asimina triloba]